MILLENSKILCYQQWKPLESKEKYKRKNSYKQAPKAQSGKHTLQDAPSKLDKQQWGLRMRTLLSQYSFLQGTFSGFSGDSVQSS